MLLSTVEVPDVMGRKWVRILRGIGGRVIHSSFGLVRSRAHRTSPGSLQLAHFLGSRLRIVLNSALWITDAGVIILCLLLGGGDHTISSRNDEFSADWERQERRTSVDELENFFCDENHVSDIISSAKNDENDDEFNGDKVLKSVNKWINNGMNGIAIGRVTNGGSVLFKVSN